MHNEPNIIMHSSYYEFNDIANTLNNNKHAFSILSTNDNLSMPKLIYSEFLWYN